VASAALQLVNEEFRQADGLGPHHLEIEALVETKCCVSTDSASTSGVLMSIRLMPAAGA
jgi:hypothetical protein